MVPDFTVPGAVFVAGEALVAGAVFVAAGEALVTGAVFAATGLFAAAGVVCALPAAAAAFTGVGDGTALGCPASGLLCPIAAVTSTVAIAKVLISFIVVPFTPSVPSTSQERPLPLEP